MQATIMREVLTGPQRRKMVRVWSKLPASAGAAGAHLSRVQDPSDDSAFYEFPRFVNHVDDSFLAQVTAIYRERIPAGTCRIRQRGLRTRSGTTPRLLPVGGAVLDLMSSHVSHLPKEVKYSRVVGHGMNAQEVC